MSKVVIIDYKLSNIFSVKHACDHVGLDAKVSSDPLEVEQADGIILPGVGAFSTAMENLAALDMLDPIRAHIENGKPFFGICLGLQLLFTESEEFGIHKGLGLVKGRVRKFPNQVEGAINYKVPQIAWNRITPSTDRTFDDTPLQGLSSDEFMYFVHSFYVEPEDDKDILTITNYSHIDYCSGILKNNNIFAVQFHPEKSGEKGLQIYKNWVDQNNLK